VTQRLASLDERLTTLAASVQPGGIPRQTVSGAPAAGRTEDTANVSQAQAQLKAAGFDPGDVSGVMNAQTRDALRRYQEAKGLPTTGQLDEQTRAALQSGR
jgi:peptidoglycan hydrolase-like protein with peptidoglycan-binding domain